jgi:hypothetical protein
VGKDIGVAAKFKLDGGMIPRTVKRMFDERAEERLPAGSSTAVMAIRDRRHVVRIVNTSPSGAMIICPMEPHIGEELTLQLLDRGTVRARVRWVRDGKIGVNFDEAPE